MTCIFCASRLIVLSAIKFFFFFAGCMIITACFCEIRMLMSFHGDPAADQIVRGPSGGCRGDLISTPNSGYYSVFYESFLLGNLRFGGCFEKPSLQALFWCKKLRSRQKIGKVTKRRRSVRPTCANSGTNRANGGTNASFCTSGDFQFFLARGQICFEFDSAAVKHEKKKERRKRILWPKAKRRDFFIFFLQGFVFGEGNRWLFTPGAKNFSCSRHRCSCVVRFACAWLNGQLGFERLSKSCTMSGGKWPSLSIQALRDDAASLSVCSMETVRSMPLAVQRSLFFTLEEQGGVVYGQKKGGGGRKRAVSAQCEVHLKMAAAGPA